MNLKIYYIDDVIDDKIDSMLIEHSDDVGKLNMILANESQISGLEYKDKKVEGLEDIVNYIVNEFYTENNNADIILLDYKLYQDHVTNERYTGEHIYQLLKKLSNAEILIITSEDSNVTTKNSLDKELVHYHKYMNKDNVLNQENTSMFSEKFLDYLNEVIKQKRFIKQAIQLSKETVQKNLKSKDEIKTINDLIDGTQFSGLTDDKIDQLIESVNQLMENK